MGSRKNRDKVGKRRGCLGVSHFGLEIRKLLMYKQDIRYDHTKY